MRTTININDDLLKKASAFTGIEERAKLINTVLERFVALESAKRLKRLGGSSPDFTVPGRDLPLPSSSPYSAMTLNEPTPS